MNFKLLYNILATLVLFIGLSFLCKLYAQKDISIHNIEVDDSLGFLNLYVKYTDGYATGEKLWFNKTDIVIYEKINKKPGILLKPESVDTLLLVEEDKILISEIHFLVDVSSKVSDEQIKNKAARIIQSIIKQNKLINKQNSNNFYLSTFSNKKSNRQKITDTKKLPSLLKSSRLRNKKSPDLFRAYVQMVKELKNTPGKKILIVIGSGINDATDNPIYEKQIPYNETDIKQLRNSTKNLSVYAIGLKDEPTPNKNLRDLVPNGYYYALEETGDPEKYSNILDDNKRILSNFLIKIQPSIKVFKGEEITYSIELVDNTASDEELFQEGALIFPTRLHSNVTPWEWSRPFLFGLLSLVLLLLIFAIIVPYLQRRKFEKWYVRAYEQGYVSEYEQENNIKIKKKGEKDPFTLEPIKEGDLIVNKCNQIIPYETWRAIGWKCPNYQGRGRCTMQGCSGVGAPEPNDLLSMQGIYLKLNWVLFGAVGGFLAWLFVSLFYVTNFQGLNTLIESLLTRHTVLNNSRIITIGNSFLVGIASGTGLTLMLSLMEELRSSSLIEEFKNSDKYSYWKSASKILRRTIVGIFVSCIAFGLGATLQHHIGSLFSGLIAWMLFGVSLGGILSYKSSISIRNGIIGGILATIASFAVFGLVSAFLNVSFLDANLISMLILGGVMGYVVMTVVTVLEDYELEIIAPEGFQRTLPISKWLKSKIGLIIGNSPESHIYVRWNDNEVKSKHAKLFMEDGNIYIKAIGKGEVLLKGRIINKPVKLKNGDVFQLGRAGITQFQYVEK